MGFWSGLGKVLGVAAPIALAPFTGGGSLAAGGAMAAGKKMLPGVLSTVGSALSGGSKSMAADRATADNNALVADRTRQGAMSDFERALEERRRLDISQRELDAKTRSDGYRQTLHSQAVQNYQPAQRPGRIPMVTGSFNTIPQSSRDFAHDFEQQAMTRALQGQKFDDMPAVERFTPTPMKQPSLWEKMSGALGLGLQTADGINRMIKKPGEPQEEEQGGLL